LRHNNKYLDVLIVITIILAIIFGANGLAVSQSVIVQDSPGVSVTRIVNGSSTGTAQYLPDENFTVELDYSVTGTQYAVSIREYLPEYWEVVDSNVPFTNDPSDPRNYTWNISSPLTGVSNGKIFYLVHIPSGTPAPDDYGIAGGVAWFSSYSDVKDGNPTGSAQTDTTHIIIDNSTEGNGPCIWISNITELSGDPSVNGNGHLEAGETAQFQYNIWDPSGIDNNYQILVNDIVVKPDSETWDPTYKYVYGTAHAPVIANTTDPNNVTNTFEIKAQGSTDPFTPTDFTLPVYVPNYNYTVWMSSEWNGFTTHSAAFEPTSSATEGGWLTLKGDNQIQVPTFTVNYNGPATIHKEVSGMISKIPFYSMFSFLGISGDASASVDMTPHGVIVPYSTYPVYREGDDVSATFNGSSEMSHKTFHVMLLDLSRMNLDLTDMSSFIDSMKSLTMENIKNSEIGSADIAADPGSSDFNVGDSNIPALEDMSQGNYVLLVMDYSMPNTPCLVSAAPFVVTKNGLETTQVGPDAMPGEPVTLSETLTGTVPDSEYVYIAAMVPEDNYSAILDVTVPDGGSVSGTSLDFHGLSMKEHGTITTDGTDAGTYLMVNGMAGDYKLYSDDLKDTAKMRGILTSELNESNVSVTVSDRTTDKSRDITLLTNDTMPTGKYIVTSVVVDRNTGKIAGINQTNITLGGSLDIPLYTGWNLISLPLKPLDDNLTAVFTPDVLKHVFVIWGYNSSNASSPWDYYVTAGYPYIQGNLTKFNESYGYWVLCYNDTTLHVTGTTADPNTITKNYGWNLVGNPVTSNRDVRSVYPESFVVWEFDGLTQQYNYWCSAADTSGSIYIQGSLNTLKPGYGYWVLELGG